MSSVTGVVVIGVAVAVISAACQAHGQERYFFENAPQTRVERARQLPLDQQYKLFRYAVDVIHPPLIDMAIPIAERGMKAVPFLLTQLREDSSDTGTKDVLIILERMTLLKSYDVKSDDALMDLLASRVERIRNNGWRGMCQQILERIRAEAES